MINDRNFELRQHGLVQFSLLPLLLLPLEYLMMEQWAMILMILSASWVPPTTDHSRLTCEFSYLELHSHLDCSLQGSVSTDLAPRWTEYLILYLQQIVSKVHMVIESNTVLLNYQSNTDIDLSSKLMNQQQNEAIWH